MGRHRYDEHPDGRRPIAGMSHWRGDGGPGRHAPRHMDYRPRRLAAGPDPAGGVCQWANNCDREAASLVQHPAAGHVLACEVHAEVAALFLERFGASGRAHP